MKSKLALFLIAFAFTQVAENSLLHAQTLANSEQRILIGPMFSIGPSITAGTIAQGYKADVGIAYTGGVMGYLPFNETTTLALRLAYDSREMSFHSSTNSNIRSISRFNYLSLRPELKFSSLVVGLGIGIPTGGSYELKGGPVGSGSLKAGNLNMMFEARIGADLPLSVNEDGEFRLLIGAGYPFTRVAKVSGTDDSRNNGPLASVQVGLAYLFNAGTK